jgi:hypothetical protein
LVEDGDVGGAGGVVLDLGFVFDVAAAGGAEGCFGGGAAGQLALYADAVVQA